MLLRNLCLKCVSHQSKTTTRWRFRAVLTQRIFTKKIDQLSRQQLAKAPQSAKKNQKSPGKVLASIFWDAPCILFIDYFKKVRAIDSRNWDNKKNCYARCHKSIAKIAKLYSELLRISKFCFQLFLSVCKPEKMKRIWP